MKNIKHKKLFLLEIAGLSALPVLFLFSGILFSETYKNIKPDTEKKGAELKAPQPADENSDEAPDDSDENKDEDEIYTEDANRQVKPAETEEPDKNAEKQGKTKEPEKSGEKDDRDKKKAEWIENAIEFDIHSERVRAINQILTIKNKNLRVKLDKKLVEIIEKEINGDVKNKAIIVSGELGLKEAVPALISRLDDESEETQISAIYAIKKIGDTSAKDVLIEKFKGQNLGENSTLIIALLETLGEFKAVEIQKYAADSILDNKTTLNNREQLVLFLGKIGSADSKDILIKILQDNDEHVELRALAANSLAKLDLKEASSVIDDEIKKIESLPFKKRKNYYKLYIYCIGALAKLGDKNAYPRLYDSLRSNNASVRLYAIKLLRELRDKRTVDILKHKVKYDQSPKVRQEAEEALKEIEGDIAKEKLKAEQSAETKKDKEILEKNQADSSQERPQSETEKVPDSK